MKIEMITEHGSRRDITYVGFVAGETEKQVALVPYLHERLRPAPSVVIRKDRIIERKVLGPQAKAKV